MGVTVTAPDGRVWTVSRSIRWPKLREPLFNGLDGLSFMDVGCAQTLGPQVEGREWRVRGFLRTRGAGREVADELSRGVFAHAEHAEPER